jgi:methylated-DNA-[protein]-cysteine S-methyltransferase
MAEPAGHAFFDTAIGRCGIAWRSSRVSGCLLPTPDFDSARRRLWRSGGKASEAPAAIADVMVRIQRLFHGEPDNLMDIALDLTDVAPFERSVYLLAREIRPGQTATYGSIARQLGDVALARAVGQALGKNPFPPIIPCHRVLAAGGRTGGFSAPGGVDTKMRLLAIEGAAPGGQLGFNFSR